MGRLSCPVNSSVDRAAEGDEVTRLVNMSVLKEITSQLEIDDAKLLRTRFVHDWRYREKAWKPISAGVQTASDLEPQQV